MKLPILTGAVVLLVALGAIRATAHHSFAAEYDDKKPIKIEGKVAEMRWANPHAWIYLDVTGTDGKVARWAFETGGANALFRRGWRKDDLPAGTELVIDGWQARNGSNTVNARSITFKKDGRRLFAGTSNTNSTEK
jgi:hypothetical protein